MAKPDAFEMAEGEGALDKLIQKGPPKKARRGKPGDPKATWRQTNLRLDPGVKERLKSEARALDVPLEDLVYVALTRFLEDLDAGRVELKPRAAATRQTLL